MGADQVKRIIVISDMHCGHSVGLTPPKHSPHYDTDECVETRRLERQRNDLWKWFAGAVDKMRPFDICICNGDAIEGTGRRSSGVELIHPDRDKQAEIASDVIKFIGAPINWMTYGTAYHTGDSEDWENVVARNVGAQKIENQGNYEVCGVNISAKHKSSNSSTPAGKFTHLAKADLNNLLWSERKQQPRADIIIRSHIHRASQAMDPGTGVTMLTTPALQGLGSRYGARECDGLPVDFGFVTIDIDSEGNYGVRFHVASMKLQAATVTKVF